MCGACRREVVKELEQVFPPRQSRKLSHKGGERGVARCRDGRTCGWRREISPVEEPTNRSSYRDDENHY